MAAVLALVGTLLVPLTASAAPPGWTSPELLGRDISMLELHSAAAVGNTIHTAYIRADPASAPAYAGRLVYRRSDDGGRTWGAERLIFRTGDRFTEVIPDIAVAAAGSTVSVTWRSREGGDALLFVRSSVDGGDTWGSRIELDRLSTDLRMGIPAAAVTADAVFVAWSSRVDGSIRLRRSTDDGATFAPLVKLGSTRHSFGCTPAMRDGLVSMIAAEDTVVVTWSDVDPGAATNQCTPNRLVLRRSLDGGTTFRAKQLLEDADTSGWAELATDGTTVLASYWRHDGRQVLARSTDAGATWSRRAFGSAPVAGGPDAGQMDVALRPNGDAVLAWTLSRTSDDGIPMWAEIRVRRSDDGGATWGAAEVAVARGLAPVMNVMNAVLVGKRPILLVTTAASYEEVPDLHVVIGPTNPAK